MSYHRLNWQQGAPFSSRYDDVYHSREGAVEEARHVFIEANDLAQRFAQCETFCVAETGFGTGLNFFLTAQSFLRHSRHSACLDYVSVEHRLLHPQDMLRSCPASLKPQCEALLQHYPPPIPGMYRILLHRGRIRLTLLLGEAESVLQDASMAVDAWFLDGFSPAKNPAMWSPQVFAHIARHSRAGTTLSTYTAAGFVRRGLQQAGFDMCRADGYGRKREMLVGRYRDRGEPVHTPPWFVLPQNRAQSKQALIVGAGIAGLSTAWQLVQRGWQVTLVEQGDEVATAASGNPAAVVMPQLAVDDALTNAWSLQAFAFARAQYRRLQRVCRQTLWHECGVLHAVGQTRAGKLLEGGHFDAVCRLAQTSLPAPHGQDWLWFGQAGWVQPRQLCCVLREACGDRLTWMQARLTQIAFENDCYHLLDASGRCFAQSAALVLANGHAVTQLTGFEHLPVSANRGQISCIDGAGDDIPGHVVMAGKYCIPLSDGRLCLGASYADNTMTAVSVQDERDTITAVQALLPTAGVEPGHIRSRVSFRALTQDRMPMLGPVPDDMFFCTAYADLHHGRPQQGYPPARYRAGLYLNVGHGSRGFTTAMLSAEILASMMEATALPVSTQLLTRLLPARFLIRQLKRSRQHSGSVWADRRR